MLSNAALIVGSIVIGIAALVVAIKVLGFLGKTMTKGCGCLLVLTLVLAAAAALAYFFAPAAAQSGAAS